MSKVVLLADKVLIIGWISEKINISIIERNKTAIPNEKKYTSCFLVKIFNIFFMSAIMYNLQTFLTKTLKKIQWNGSKYLILLFFFKATKLSFACIFEKENLKNLVYEWSNKLLHHPLKEYVLSPRTLHSISNNNLLENLSAFSFEKNT